LFLDELGEMSFACRRSCCALWRAARFSAWIGPRRRPRERADRRATNRNLSERIAAERVREDLYYRLNVIRPKIPLRERYATSILLQHYWRKREDAIRVVRRGCRVCAGDFDLLPLAGNVAS